MQGVFVEHHAWWMRKHGKDRAQIAALAAFKPLRRFVQGLLESELDPKPGVDWHDTAQEALGDMILYLMSYCHAGCLPWVPPVLVWEFATADEAVAALARTFAALLSAGAHREALYNAVAVVLGACRLCCVDPEEAARRSLRKCR
jgi:hypothetical protein